MPKMKTTAEAIAAGLRTVTKDWARQRKAEERDASRRHMRYARLVRYREKKIKEVAYEVMEQAYLKASANGTLPANARQIMYAARPLIQQQTEKKLDDQYFTQTLLPDYMREHGVSWNVVFDDRGHFHEPHTVRSIGLGTLAVRDYLGSIREPRFEEAGFAAASIKTFGPRCRFGAVLFIEKEGFMPLFDHVRLAKRYDLAIMSTKGLSNTAARLLVDNMCGRYGIPLLVLHDFDKAGFSIVGTLKQSNRRYNFRNNIEVIDLGLRLDDVENLEPEDAFDRGSEYKIRANLRDNGATAEEIDFLLTSRVELNAFASDELVGFIEQKLEEYGIKKVLPDQERLAEAFQLFARSARVQEAVEAALEDDDPKSIEVPADLAEQVEAHLEEHPEEPWEVAVQTIAGRLDDGTE
jgi:DNA topoisomerase VI subunit A